MKNVPFLCLVASLFLPFVPDVRAAAGDLDPSFAGTGMLQIGFGRSDDQGRAVALQLDGKIVMAGTIAGRVVLARFTTNNILDATFGSGGVVYTTVVGYPQIIGLRARADGKLVIAGDRTGYGGRRDFLLACFNQ